MKYKKTITKLTKICNSNELPTKFSTKKHYENYALLKIRPFTLYEFGDEVKKSRLVA